MVFQKYDHDIPISDLTFQRASFWVQAHDLPIRFITREVAKSVCDTIDTVYRLIGGVDEDGVCQS